MPLSLNDIANNKYDYCWGALLIFLADQESLSQKYKLQKFQCFFELNYRGKNVIFIRRILLLGLMCIYVPSSHAELTIEITEGIESALPVAVVPFASAGAPVDISAVVNADLERSGYFKMMAEQSMSSRPSSAQEVNFQEWQSLGQNYLVVGRVNNGGGQYNVQFQLLDVFKGGQLLGYKMASSAGDLRRTAHHISDLIFEKLTGKKGVFSGRIAYITTSRQGGSKQP